MPAPTYYERVSARLLKGIPKPKPFGKLVDGRWITGHKSLHKTPQGVKWNKFWLLRFRIHNTNLKLLQKSD